MTCFIVQVCSWCFNFDNHICTTFIMVLVIVLLHTFCIFIWDKRAPKIHMHCFEIGILDVNINFLQNYENTKLFVFCMSPKGFLGSKEPISCTKSWCCTWIRIIPSYIDYNLNNKWAAQIYSSESIPNLESLCLHKWFSGSSWLFLYMYKFGQILILSCKSPKYL